MGSVVNGDVIRVTAKMAYNSGIDDIQNVYHYRYTGVIPCTDELVHEALADWLDDAYQEIKASIPTTTTFVTIETWNFTQDRPMIEDSWPVMTAGTGTGETMPAQCAPLCLFTTATARSQGRKYLPFMRELDMANGILGSSALARITGYLTFIISTIGAGGGLLTPGNYSPEKVRFAAWIGAIAKDVIRTQRRRVRGVGS